jgi:hypothetical protein
VRPRLTRHDSPPRTMSIDRIATVLIWPVWAELLAREAVMHEVENFATGGGARSSLRAQPTSTSRAGQTHSVGWIYRTQD